MLVVRPALVTGKPARTPCPDERYIVQNGPLLPGAPAEQIDVVTVGTAPELSIGCDGTHRKGKVKVRARKRGTSIAASWQGCGGLSGRIRLTGMVTEECAVLTGTLRAKGFKRKLTAARSTCGDGVRDTGRPEACDTGGVACAGGDVCTTDCACVPAATTTTLPPEPCKPFTQVGCSPGEKCTWIRVVETPEPLGELGCVADGTVAAEGACTQGAAGTDTGFDDCQAGLICINGLCKDICGFDGSPAAMCDDNNNCTRYADLFSNGAEDPSAGACTPGCDPVSQLRNDGTSCPGGQGCYLLSSLIDTVAVCAGAGTLAHGQTITGTAFANTCLPGHMPRQKDQATQTQECGALCRPADVYQGNNVGSEGGVSPDTCESKGAAPPADVTDGESCRYYWSREKFDTTSAYSNTVGWCFKHADFQYDSNKDLVPDTAFPRCVDLTTGDVVSPIGDGNDALIFWCLQQPAMLTSPLVALGAPVERRQTGGEVLLDRVGNWR
jgi:hypothetical protein